MRRRERSTSRTFGPWRPVTLALPKTRLLTADAAHAVGAPELYAEMGLEVSPIFARQALLPIDRDRWSSP